MTFIEKVKQTIERATGCRFYYHAAGELNAVLAGVEIGAEPIAFAYMLKGGEVAVGKSCREGVNLAVFFCKKTEFDFNSFENEQLIDDCKRLAFGWVSMIYKSNLLDVVGSVTTERVYDTTTDILTGIAVNITLRELDGYGLCDLPYREKEITENGVYDVAGFDAVNINVTDGVEVEEPAVYSFAVTENGLHRLQRMNSYTVFVNVPPPYPLSYEENHEGITDVGAKITYICKIVQNGDSVKYTFDITSSSGGLIPVIWDNSNGFREVLNTNTITFNNCSVGQKLSVACKWMYPLGETVTPYIDYVVKRTADMK